MGYFLMIADDFTGAADSGVQMTKNGIETHIVFDADHIDENKSYVIDTETRNLSGEEAYAKVKGILTSLKGKPFDHYYKKIDSTIRGNIHDELQSAIEVLEPELIVFNPGNPDNGRIVMDGTLMMNGVRILNTEIVKDPLSRVKEDNLKRLLESAMHEPVRHFTLEEIRSGKLQLGEERILTYDLLSNGDSETIVRFVMGTGKRVLWVGSAGLANVLLHFLKPKYPVLALVGSISNISREQVLNAVQDGAQLVPVSIAEILKGKPLDSYARIAVSYLKEEKDVVVVTAQTRTDYEEAVRVGEKMGMSKEDVCVYTQSKIGELSSIILKQVKVKGLFLTGGDTTISVTKANHSTGAMTQREILPTVAQVVLDGGDYPELPCVVKGGAIGNADALVKAIHYIKEEL